jgi:putative hydrolases of HD superfamily
LSPDDTLSLLRGADLLEALPRTGWLTCRVPAAESIAAHSYGVAFTTMLLADLIAQRAPAPDFDRSRALEMALVHDLGEAITTDVPSPVKQFVGRDAMKAGERRAVAQLTAAAGGRYLELYDEYTARQTLEARVVRAADKIQLLVKASQYGAAGFAGVERFWRSDDNDDHAGVPEARELLDRLRAHHDAGSWPSGDWL